MSDQVPRGNHERFACSSNATWGPIHSEGQNINRARRGARGFWPGPQRERMETDVVLAVLPGSPIAGRPGPRLALGPHPPRVRGRQPGGLRARRARGGPVLRLGARRAPLGGPPAGPLLGWDLETGRCVRRNEGEPPWLVELWSTGAHAELPRAGPAGDPIVVACWSGGGRPAGSARWVAGSSAWSAGARAGRKEPIGHAEVVEQHRRAPGPELDEPDRQLAPVGHYPPPRMMRRHQNHLCSACRSRRSRS
jgi:hypothetical protein